MKVIKQLNLVRFQPNRKVTVHAKLCQAYDQTLQKLVITLGFYKYLF